MLHLTLLRGDGDEPIVSSIAMFSVSDHLALQRAHPSQEPIIAIFELQRRLYDRKAVSEAELWLLIIMQVVYRCGIPMGCMSVSRDREWSARHKVFVIEHALCRLVLGVFFDV